MAAKVQRMRLDELLVARGLVDTRSAARSLIMAGGVLVSGEVSDKAGTPVAVDAEVMLKARPRFVSRAGEKLAHALDEFRIDVTGALALDVGASTGGFVDCLLQAGAAQVIALDVGRGQLDGKLQSDPRVRRLEKVNARYLTPDQLPYTPDFLTMDVSFISVRKVLPAVLGSVGEVFRGAVLIKPQFEAGPEAVGRGGIVRDADVHRRVLMETGAFVVSDTDAELIDVCRSGLPGTGGNKEFFLHMTRGGEKGVGLDTLERLVDSILSDVPHRETG